MDAILISVILAFGILLIAQVVVAMILYIRFRRIVVEKDLSILRRIHERDYLEKELEHAHITIEALEKCLKEIKGN